MEKVVEFGLAIIDHLLHTFSCLCMRKERGFLWACYSKNETENSSLTGTAS